MKNTKTHNKFKQLFHCIRLSAICGAFTGAFIFIFKLFASSIIFFSTKMYNLVRENLQYSTYFFAGIIALALLSFLILKLKPGCKGGGIPSAVTYIRGFVSFDWISSSFILFFSALITFFAGIPLGNEGPSVQIGCAIGRGTTNIFGKKNKAFDKYIMTGGASAGFATATGAPLSSLIFSIEELHHRFSTTLFTSASVSILSASLTMELLCLISGRDNHTFNFTISEILPTKYIWAAILVGIVSGFLAIGFTVIYKFFNNLLNHKMKKSPLAIKVILIFAIVGVLGLVSGRFIGTGHSIIDELIETHSLAFSTFLICLVVRALLLIFANNIGITGGLFIPSLAFGAIVGDLMSHLLISTGSVPQQYRLVLIVVGMASFLAAASRIPMTAIAFSFEALSGLSNILPIAMGVVFAFLVIEFSGVASFSDTIVESKISHSRKNKTLYSTDVHLTAKADAFAVGRELRELLLPPSCIVISIEKVDIHSHIINEGDVIHLHYQTVTPTETFESLEALFGKQDGDIAMKYVHISDNHYNIPETL